MESAKSRILWIDVFKGIGILLMLMAHLIPDSIPGTAVKPESLIISYIYSFHMPLFFFASGYTFSLRRYNNYFQFLMSRVRSILIPYTVFFLFPLVYRMIFQLFGLMGAIDVKTLITAYLYADGVHLGILNMSIWFLPSLFIAQSLTYFFFWKKEKVDKKKTTLETALSSGNEETEPKKTTLIPISLLWLLVTIAGWGIAKIFYPQSLPWSWVTSINGMSLMLLGMLFKKHEGFFSLEQSLHKKWYIMLLGALGLLLCLMNGRIGMAANHYGNSYILYYLTVVFSLLFYMYISKALANQQWLVWCGQNSLMILGLHGTAINFVNWLDICNLIGIWFNFTIDPLSHLILSTIFVLALTIPLTLVFKKFVFSTNSIKPSKAQHVEA